MAVMMGVMTDDPRVVWCFDGDDRDDSGYDTNNGGHHSDSGGHDASSHSDLYHKISSHLAFRKVKLKMAEIEQ